MGAEVFSAKGGNYGRSRRFKKAATILLIVLLLVQVVILCANNASAGTVSTYLDGEYADANFVVDTSTVQPQKAGDVQNVPVQVTWTADGEILGHDYVLTVGGLSVTINDITTDASGEIISPTTGLPAGVSLSSDNKSYVWTTEVSVMGYGDKDVPISLLDKDASAPDNEETGVLTIPVLQLCTVTFMNDGAVYETEDVVYNQTVSAPDSPIVVGKYFAGWYEEDTFNTTVAFPYTVTGNISLYAKMVDNSTIYDITFYNEDGSVYETATAQYNDLISAPATDPAKAGGYLFAGWYKDAGCNYKFDFSSDRIIKDTDLYAGFVRNTEVCSITYILDGKRFDRETGVVVGDSVYEPYVELEGRIFDGWYENADCTGDKVVFPYVLLGDTKLYGKTVLDTVDVTLKETGAYDRVTGLPVTDVARGDTVSFTVTLDSSEDPASLAVTANGVALNPVKGENNVWHYSFPANADTEVAVSDLSTKQYVVALPVGDNFTAVFKTPAAFADMTSATVEYGDTYSFTVTPKNGYEVKAVYINGQAVTADADGIYTSDAVTGEQNISISMEEVVFHTVTYIVDGAQMTTRQVQEGTMVNSIPDVAAPDKAGYIFDGWYLDNAFTEDAADAEDSVLLTGIMDVYGRYNPVQNQIIYDLNGGDSAAIPATIKTYGQAAVLTSVVPEREGHVFLGWGTSSTDTVPAYSSGATYSTEIDQTAGSVTLYAIWAKQTYNVILPVGTGYTVVPDISTPSTTVAYGESFKFVVTVDSEYSVARPVVSANGVELNASGDSLDDNPYTYEITNISEDQIVSIQVSKNPIYTVTYQYQDENGALIVNGTSIYTTMEVEHGHKAVQPTPPVVEGYTFGGWFADEAFETPFVFSATPIVEDTTVFAKFTANTYTIDMPADPAGADVEPNVDQTVDHGATFEFTIAIEDGYDASRMSVAANGYALSPVAISDDGKTLTYRLSNIAEDIEVTVVGVVRKTVIITYNKNALDAVSGMPEQQVVNYYVDGADDNSVITDQKPVRNGYDFLGWSTNSSAQEADYVAGDTADFTSDTTLYAVWDIIEIIPVLTIDSDYTGAEVEGKDITLTATLPAAAKGTVTFYKRDIAGNTSTVGTQIINGKITSLTCKAGEFKDESPWKETYWAEFVSEEAEGFTGGISADVELRIYSSAISWDLNTDLTAKNTLTVAGTLDANGKMIVGNTYTLTIPAVMALNSYTNDPLAAGTDYEVIWQSKTASSEWKNLTTTTTNSFVITEHQAGVVYRALVKGISEDFNKAAKFNYDGDQKLVSDQYLPYLYTAATDETVLQPTSISISFEDVLTNAADTPDCSQNEGKTIRINANVIGADGKGVFTGVVTFYVVTDDTGAYTKIGEATVSNGRASITYTMPDYTRDDSLDNIKYFFAVYNDVANTYDSCNTAGLLVVSPMPDTVVIADIDKEGEAVKILSTTISWQIDENNKIVTGANKLAVYEADENGVKGDVVASGSMVAGSNYILELPKVYALDETVYGAGSELTIGQDYTVTWQYREFGASSWNDYTNKVGGDSVLITPAFSGYQFQAVVTPIYDNTALTGYKTAAKYTDDFVVGKTASLITLPTVETVVQPTTTDLIITGADEESAAVKINGDTTVFTAVGDHIAQFEGQTVVLKASVIDNATGEGVTNGKVYFYRYVDGTNDILLNATAVETVNGIAEYTATVAKYDDANTAVDNTDRFYAVYEENATYAGSASVAQTADVYSQPDSFAVDSADCVFIKSASIQTPVIMSKLAGKIGGTVAYETTYDDNLAELLSGVEHEFTLKANHAADDATADWSVVALDGRTVAAENYEIQWLKTSGDNEENLAAKNAVTMKTTVTKDGDKYRLWLEPLNDMKVGAHSNYMIIGTKQDVNVVVTASDEIASTPDTDVYQLNEITLTASVVGVDENPTMQPTGNVTFYYATDETVTDDTVWTEIGTATLNLNTVSGKMEASIATSVLPVDENGKTKENVTITAIYLGDRSFYASGEIDAKNKITDTTTGEVIDDVVTVYSSVVHRSIKENEVYTPVEIPAKADGIMIYADGFVVLENETNIPLKITDVYTLDYADENVGETIAKLVYGTDYTVKWQICRNFGAYTADERVWVDLPDATTANYLVNVEQGAAYRAVVTVADTAPAKGSFTEVQQNAAPELDGDKIYYSNILVASKGQADLTVSVNTSDLSDGMEGIVEGETVTIHTYVSGATMTVPISQINWSITDKDGNAVLKDELGNDGITKTNVNGYVAIDWDTTNVTPGYYTLTVSAHSTNGYADQVIKRTLIVRDDNYIFTVTDDSKVYNGKAQEIDWTLTGVDIEAEYAQKAAYVIYTQNGEMVEPVQAGEYEYELILPESAYWTQHSVTGTFTIEAREVSVVDLVAQAKIYNNDTDANIQEIILNDAATDQADTGLPTDDIGVINGDSVYAVGVGYTSDKIGEVDLGVNNVQLMGDDAHNYVLVSSDYTETIKIQRNQLKGDIADATYAYTGEDILLPADDVYLINQQGDVVTDYTVTYYYHYGEGVEKVDAMNKLGMYTVIVSKDPLYFKGGASQTVYVAEEAIDAEPKKYYVSSVISINDTAQLYGESSGVTVSATNLDAEDLTVAYYVDGAWTESVPENAGRYLVKVTTSTVDTAYGIYTITKAYPELQITAESRDYNSDMYDGNKDFTFVAGLSDPSAEVYYSFAGDTIQGFAHEAPTEVGQYVVTAHVGETRNYTAHEISAVYSIDPIQLTVTAASLQRHLHGEYPDMIASFDGLATGGVAVDTSLRDVQIQPEFIYDNHRNFAEGHVGRYTVTPVSALARNYDVRYIEGEFAVTAEEANPALAIHGMIDNGSAEENLVYFGDEIQLFAYGSQDEDRRVINNSSVLKWSVQKKAGFVGDVTISSDGLLDVEGVGDFTVTLTRGTGAQAISVSIDVVAKKQEVKVVIPAVDKVYSGSEQTYDGDVIAVDGKLAKIDDSYGVDFDINNDKRTDIGSQVVTGVVKESAKFHQSEEYGGLFTINDKEVIVAPGEQTTVYGTLETYDDTPRFTEKGRVNGVSAITKVGIATMTDAYSNLDVYDGYEILVAGKENINYNVKYTTDQDALDAAVTELDLQVETGSYDGSIGLTGGSLNPLGDYPANGAEFSGVFEAAGLRMYGEPNQIMGYRLTSLILGDSMADLNGFIDWLVEYDKLIDADANVEYEDKTTVIPGRVAPYYIETNVIDMVNYNDIITKGTQNIYQRPVTLTTTEADDTVYVYYTDAENDDILLAAILAGLNVEKYTTSDGKEIGGLAELLKHTIADVDLEIISKTYEDGILKTVTIKTKDDSNYWSEATTVNIELVKDHYLVVYEESTANRSTIRVYKVDEEGNRTLSNLPGSEQRFAIYVKNGAYATYQDYVNGGAEVIREGTLKNIGTGRYTASYATLPRGSYKFFAIPANTSYYIEYES